MTVQKLVLKNQFGEESINFVEGSYIPLPGAGSVIIMVGATAPVDGTTGDNIAGPGSLYIAKDTGLLYQQTSLITTPVWVQAGSGTTGGLLTGFVSGAGTVAASDTILQAFNKLAGNAQNKTVLANVLTAFAASAGIVAATDTVLEAFQKLGPIMNLTPALTGANAETVSAAGAISTTKALTSLANSTGAGIAVTLAAPSSQDGQIKVLKMTVRTSNDMTLAMTNIAMSGAYTPTGTTTLTFSAVGQTAVLMAVGSKWVYLGGSAVAS